MASFKSVLKKIGEVTLKVGEQVVGLEGIAEMVFPKQAATIAKVVDTFDQLSGIIITAEQMGAALGVPGSDKLKMSVPLLSQVILQTQVLAHGRKIKDQALFDASMAQLGSALAGIWNSVSDDGVSTESKAG